MVDYDTFKTQLQTDWDARLAKGKARKENVGWRLLTAATELHTAGGNIGELSGRYDTAYGEFADSMVNLAPGAQGDAEDVASVRRAIADKYGGQTDVMKRLREKFELNLDVAMEGASLSGQYAESSGMGDHISAVERTLCATDEDKDNLVTRVNEERTKKGLTALTAFAPALEWYETKYLPTLLR